ncbi:class I SAM-dependent methyltransferase [Microbulbifer agarilyticus]|uniref:class I SAM-dependent methyltransferase n=1 Tax=Microbulbifer agarilyticus TaxID=260552 RepID=UPI001C94E98F|nr:class I SAM-dependent methyltransferase [Microbulbifer agarilyticus]MBY6210891.1 class I SAM-dependent methyltransferase [Microbulbifer agarilyticus]
MADAARQAPPAWNAVGRHGVFPKANHDEVARFNFLTNLNIHLASQVLPGVRKAYDHRVEQGAVPTTRREVGELLKREPLYQFWSSLRRNTMEMRQQNGRAMVFRQLPALIDQARTLNKDSQSLQLNPEVKVPRYISAVDIHCMPGGYHTEYCEDDIAAGANYDSGIFVTTAGMLGRYSDGGGQALVEWLREQAEKGFRPRRILDIGCTVGHNIVPLAQAFPDTEIVAIDVAAPMLRYANARAKSLGVNNILFRQENAEAIEAEDGSFDLIITCMFLHETSSRALPRILAETHRLLADGGKVVHIEQPQFTPDMPPYEQFMRDWDTRNNNEPFWGTLHDMDLFEAIEQAGFARENIATLGLYAVVDEELFPSAAKAESDTEDYGRKPAWHAYIASK